MNNINKEIVNKIMENPYDYNINNEYNKEFEFVNNKEVRYPNLKAYIKSYLGSISNKYDCDVSKYSITYYKLAWDFLECGDISNQQNYNKKDSKKEIKIPATFRGDTLNSLKSPFNNFFSYGNNSILKSFYSEFYNQHKLWTWFFLSTGCETKEEGTNYKVKGILGDGLYKKYNLSKPKNMYLKGDIIYKRDVQKIKYEWLLYNFDNVFIDENLSKVKCCKEILDQFEIFASLSATIGNQFPCPLYFNSERSNYGKHEYPDLLLEAIYNYYNSSEISEKRSTLAKLFIGESGEKYISNKNHSRYVEATELSINYCYNWLSYFKDWNSFVDKNFFQDFVEYDDINNCYGRPKALWKVNSKDHSFDNLKLPDIGEQFVEYLKSINTGIKKRGESIKEKAMSRIRKLNINE